MVFENGKDIFWQIFAKRSSSIAGVKPPNIVAGHTAATAGFLHERPVRRLYVFPFVCLGDPVHVRLFASHLFHKCLLNTNNRKKSWEFSWTKMAWGNFLLTKAKPMTDVLIDALYTVSLIPRNTTEQALQVLKAWKNETQLLTSRSSQVSKTRKPEQWVPFRVPKKTRAGTWQQMDEFFLFCYTYR